MWSARYAPTSRDQRALAEQPQCWVKRRIGRARGRAKGRRGRKKEKRRSGRKGGKKGGVDGEVGGSAEDVRRGVLVPKRACRGTADRAVESVPAWWLNEKTAGGSVAKTASK